MIPQEAWLRKSHQIWKFNIFLILISFGFIALVSILLRIKTIWIIGEVNNVQMLSSLVLFGASALLWLSFSIRCPKCNNKVAWKILKTEPASVWLMRLMYMENCPSCDDD